MKMSTKDLIELKPCPFCGGKAWSFQNDPLHKNDEAFYVYGVLCDCGASILKNRMEDAIEAWNRRAENG